MSIRVDYSYLSFIDFSSVSMILVTNFQCDTRIIKVRITKSLEKKNVLLSQLERTTTTTKRPDDKKI